eukprot:COSAG01_NODE_57340_length_312_cov_819.413146_1_plen_54_part_00
MFFWARNSLLGPIPCWARLPARAETAGNGGDSMYKSSILSLGFSPFTPHSNLN